MTHPALGPDDSYNQQLANLVHPPTWTNPTPKGRYHLVVIGAGTAGLVTAAGAAGLGAKVALIERDLMGGDCLNVGCVPSKALISAARAAAAVRSASSLGIHTVGPINVDFPAIMQRMRRLRSELAPNDSASRFTSLGVDVFLGSGQFSGPDTIDVAGQKLQFKHAVIATGARASRPEAPGLADAGYLTNETIFSLTTLPPRLVIVGGGPIGCELAQSFARFGSQVTLIERSGQLLGREDEQAAQLIQASLERDGVQVRLNALIQQVSSDHNGEKWMLLSHGGDSTEIQADQILVGAGRTPNVDGLNLELVGVRYDKVSGVVVNDRLQTTNPRIYAAGDICSPYKFTHAADFMARIVIQNSLFYGRSRNSSLSIPWCTYTSPEVAHVGWNEKDAKQKGIAIQTFVQDLKHIDRAILQDESEGFVKIHVKKGSDRIVGATIVAEHAGEMIGEIVLAIGNQIGLKKLASTIHPYPTVAEAIRKCGDSYNKTRLTPFIKTMFSSWLRWTN